MKSDPICIAFTINDHFGMQVAVTLYSLLLYASPECSYSIFILGNGIRKETRVKIEAIASRFPNINSVAWLDAAHINLSALPRTRATHFSPEVYLRLFLPEVIPASVNRLLYLDADVLVEADIAQLFSVPMSDKTILAVRDFGFHDLATGLPLAIKELGSNPDRPYFNSGVMMMDIKRWRSCGYFNLALLFMEKFKDDVQWGDQDVLNALLVDDWGPLDEMWNVQLAACLNYAGWMNSSFKKALAGRVRALIDPPCVLHFVGPWKPWLPGLDNRLQKRYFFYLSRSGWFNPLQFCLWYINWFFRGLFSLILQ